MEPISLNSPNPKPFVTTTAAAALPSRSPLNVVNPRHGGPSLSLNLNMAPSVAEGMPETDGNPTDENSGGGTDNMYTDDMYTDDMYTDDIPTADMHTDIDDMPNDQMSSVDNLQPNPSLSPPLLSSSEAVNPNAEQVTVRKVAVYTASPTNATPTAGAIFALADASAADADAKSEGAFENALNAAAPGATATPPPPPTTLVTKTPTTVSLPLPTPTTITTTTASLNPLPPLTFTRPVRVTNPNPPPTTTTTTTTTYDPPTLPTSPSPPSATPAPFPLPSSFGVSNPEAPPAPPAPTPRPPVTTTCPPPPPTHESTCTLDPMPPPVLLLLNQLRHLHSIYTLSLQSLLPSPPKPSSHYNAEINNHISTLLTFLRPDPKLTYDYKTPLNPPPATSDSPSEPQLLIPVTPTAGLYRQYQSFKQSMSNCVMSTACHNGAMLRAKSTGLGNELKLGGGVVEGDCQVMEMFEVLDENREKVSHTRAKSARTRYLRTTSGCILRLAPLITFSRQFTTQRSLAFVSRRRRRRRPHVCGTHKFTPPFRARRRRARATRRCARS